MGGAASSIDETEDGLTQFLDREISFPGSDDLVRWDMDAVRAAHQRLLELKQDFEPPFHALTYVLSKNEFFEVFNDFGRLVDGAFLSLPLSLYHKIDHNDNCRVFYPEVATLLCLYSHGAMADKTAFLFQLYDMNASGDMTVDEMIMLMTTIASACFKVGITNVPPRLPEMETTVREMFLSADTSNDGVIEMAEFDSWARFHIRSKVFLDRFVQVADADLPENGGSAYAFSVYHHAATQNSPKVRTQHHKGPRVRNRLTAVASRSLMQTLSINTAFSLPELEALRNQFAEVADDECHLGCEAFVRIMEERFPELERGTLLESIFHCFDNNGDGVLNFKEFAVSMAKLLRGNLSEKIELVFHILDVNGDGEIEVTEVVSLINKSRADLTDIIAFTEEAIASLDIDGDGEISEDEWVSAMTRHPLLINTFANSIKFSFDPIPVRELEAAGIGFNYESLVSLVGSAEGEYSQDEFCRFICERFVGPYAETKEEDADLVSLIGNVFRSFDFDHSGSVEFREILAGIAHEFADSPEQQAQFYFSLYDADQSGAIDKDEIVSILLNLQHNFDSNVRHCLEVLKQLDTDHNGSVSFAEFSAAMHRSPRLIKCFGDIFTAH